MCCPGRGCGARAAARDSEHPALGVGDPAVGDPHAVVHLGGLSLRRGQGCRRRGGWTHTSRFLRVSGGVPPDTAPGGADEGRGRKQGRCRSLSKERWIGWSDSNQALDGTSHAQPALAGQGEGWGGGWRACSLPRRCWGARTLGHHLKFSPGDPRPRGAHPHGPLGCFRRMVFPSRSCSPCSGASREAAAD